MKLSLVCGFAVCLVLTELTGADAAVQCYVCTACNDPFDAGNAVASKVSCPGGCMKTKTEGIVVRSCSILSTSDSCNTVELFGVKSEACTCTADLCNSAQTMTSSYVIVVVSVLAFLTKIAKF